MHTWIASALVIVTLMVMFHRHRLYELENANELELILFFIEIISPIIFLSIWLFLIT